MGKEVLRLDLKKTFRIELLDENVYGGCKITKAALVHDGRPISFAAITRIDQWTIALDRTELRTDECEGELSFRVPGIKGTFKVGPEEIHSLTEEDAGI